jgi:osmoprotectant transport system ATP-binding protein
MEGNAARVHYTGDLRNQARVNGVPVAASVENMIEVLGASWRANPASSKEILVDVSLAVPRGTTLVLLGRSGSGKTTLLKLINGMLQASSGEVRVEGRTTQQWDVIRLRRQIGYVIQEAGLFPHFTVAENVGLVPRLENWPTAKIEARVEEMLRLVGLEPREFAARRPRELSGGQRQRVGVARALAADPPILLMDEPFGALDPVTRVELQREFRALAQRLGKTIVFVTHDLREAILLASNIVLLDKGRVVAGGKPAEFLRLPHPEVQAFAVSLELNGAPV